MTARHVVEPIMRTAPFTQQQQPQLPDQPQLSDDNVIIDFCYEWNSLPSDPNHIYYFESEIVYESVNLDTVIIKLKPHTKAFPPPLTRFTDVTRLSQDTSHGYFIGHSQADIKKTDKYHIVTLTKSDIDTAKKWSLDFEKVDGYDVIENQQRVLFHCSFEQGASGSPGFWINPGDGQSYVELMLLCGYPKWLYNKYQGNTRGIPNHFLVEQGVSMKSVYDDVKARDALLCNAVFGTKS
ncbi:hypothetical protein ACJMK2_013856 [Sinanodonta woodiana]|uniref:Uncharacterized protein n=1 Tax=Sinanodonta woodiana TaxID=1069815 RepID=A0ABD3UZC2_SINWO